LAVRETVGALPLAARLRAETSDVHQQLEDSLDLLGGTLDRCRLITLLERFYGFHALLEPGLERHIDSTLLSGRPKLHLIEKDLVALGVTHDTIERLPLCDTAAELAADACSAMGALYVMEGSTLGGKIITRALRQTQAWPAAGLHYFDPYASRMGIMWNEYRAHLATMSSPGGDTRIIAGARSTFTTLLEWLAPAFRRPK
jgi:heme oxygenase